MNKASVGFGAIFALLLILVFPFHGFAQDGKSVVDSVIEQFTPSTSNTSDDTIADGTPAFEEEPIIEEPDIPDMVDMPMVKLRSLDKTTARRMTFKTDVGSTLKFGPIFIKVQSCRKSSPVEEPESAAFLQVWENTPEGKPEWIFSGWMFASSPGLSAMDHPIYDVWVLDCLDHDAPDEGGEESATVEPEDAQNLDQAE